MAHGLGPLVSKDAEKSKQLSDSMTQNMKKGKTYVIKWTLSTAWARYGRKMLDLVCYCLVKIWLYYCY